MKFYYQILYFLLIRVSYLNGNSVVKNFENQATVVSAYYMFKSKHALTQYEEWISNFMRMNFQSVIYCDAKSHAKLSHKYPETNTRKYIVREIDNLTTSHWNWDWDFQVDPENGYHTINLYKVWNEKIFFVADAIKANYYNTTTFTWVDIGCFRHPDMVKHFDGFPDSRKFVHDKVSFLLPGGELW